MSSVVDNHLDGYMGLTEKVRRALENAAKEFVYIGFLLLEAENCQYYLEGGYESIYAYCEQEFGFGRSSTNNFIRVYRQFGTTNGIGIEEKYKPYSYSQLTEMCSMNDKQLKICSPEMTVRELRSVKKGTKSTLVQTEIEVKEIEASPASVQTSGRGTNYGEISTHQLMALEKYLRDRFSCKLLYNSPERMCDFVINTGADFRFEIAGEGAYKVSIMCQSDSIEVNFNGNKSNIPYTVAYYMSVALTKFGVNSTCILKQDIQIPELGRCSKCGDLNDIEANYCSNCGAKVEGVENAV